MRTATCFFPAVSSRPADSERSPRRNGVVAAAAIVVAVVLAYANSVAVPFVFDDVPAIASAAQMARGGTRAGSAAAEDAGATTSGRPLLSLTLIINHAIGGQRVEVYHVTNFLIHALAGLALFGTARRSLQLGSVPVRLRTAANSVAATIAALWTLHPLQTEAVTYVVQRAESLAGLLLLLTLYCYLRSINSPRAGRWRALSLLACVLGMATKESTAAGPLLVLLHDRTFVAGSFRAAWQCRRAFYLGLAGTWLLLAALVLGTEGRGGTAGFDAGISAWHYLLTQCYALVHYLRLSVWPHPLVFDYGTELIRDAGDVPVQAGVLLLLAGATAWGAWRNLPWGFLGCLFFATLAPSSSIVPVASQTIAEHRMYIALIAPIALATAGGYRVLGRRAMVAWAMAAVVLAGLTFRRNDTYRTELKLWSDTVAKRPGNSRAHHNLGLAELKDGRIDAAMAHFAAALQLRPDSADSRYNLGLCLMKLGQPAAALEHYRHAIVDRPWHAEAHNNLGTTLLAFDRPTEARASYERALHLRPGFAEAHANLADVLLRLGEANTALRHARAALESRPDFAEAHLHAGNACAELQRFDDARVHFETALRLDSNHAGAHNNLANVLVESGRLREAVSHYDRALQLDPGYFKARRNLALLLLHLNRPAQALPHLEELARASPGDAEIRRVLTEARTAVQR